jgi:hypothetical protein
MWCLRWLPEGLIKISGRILSKLPSSSNLLAISVSGPSYNVYLVYFQLIPVDDRIYSDYFRSSADYFPNNFKAAVTTPGNINNFSVLR